MKTCLDTEASCRRVFRLKTMVIWKAPPQGFACQGGKQSCAGTHGNVEVSTRWKWWSGTSEPTDSFFGLWFYVFLFFPHKIHEKWEPFNMCQYHSWSTNWHEMVFVTTTMAVFSATYLRLQLTTADCHFSTGAHLAKFTAQVHCRLGDAWLPSPPASSLKMNHGIQCFFTVDDSGFPRNKTPWICMDVLLFVIGPPGQPQSLAFKLQDPTKELELLYDAKAFAEACGRLRSHEGAAILLESWHSAWTILSC